jgi:hypothetical protein
MQLVMDGLNEPRGCRIVTMVTRIALALAAVQTTSAQSNKELEKIYAEDPAENGDILTGRYSNASSCGTIVGVR